MAVGAQDSVAQRVFYMVLAGEEFSKRKPFLSNFYRRCRLWCMGVGWGESHRTPPAVEELDALECRNIGHWREGAVLPATLRGWGCGEQPRDRGWGQWERVCFAPPLPASQGGTKESHVLRLMTAKSLVCRGPH